MWHNRFLMDIPHFDINMTEEGDTLQISNYCRGWDLKEIKKKLNCNNCNAAFEKGPRHRLTTLHEFDSKKTLLFSLNHNTFFEK